MTGDSPVEIDPFNKVLAYEVANYFNTLGWYQLLTGEFANCEKLVRRGVIPAERQQDAEAILSLLEKP